MADGGVVFRGGGESVSGVGWVWGDGLCLAYTLPTPCLRLAYALPTQIFKKSDWTQVNFVHFVLIRVCSNGGNRKLMTASENHDWVLQYLNPCHF